LNTPQFMKLVIQGVDYVSEPHRKPKASK
jgi:hypothetical protein